MSWTMSFSRGLGMQKGIDYASAIGKEFDKVFGTRLHSVLYIKEKDNLEFYLKIPELEKLLDHLEKTVFDPRMHSKFKNSVRDSGKILSKIQKLIDRSINKDNDTIAQALLQIKELRQRFFAPLWYNVIFEQRLEEVFMRVMAKYPGVDNTAFLTLSEPTFIAKEQIDFLKVKNKKQLLRHVKKYAFIPMYDYDYEPYGISDFKNRKVKDSRKDLAESKKAYKKEIAKVDKKDRKFLEFFHYIVWLKDERSRYRNTESFMSRPFYEEIAKRLELTLKETINLTYDEIVSGLRTGVVDKKEIKLRKEHYAVLIEGNKTTILTGKRFREFVSKSIKSRLKEGIAGTVASFGKAKGRVKIVLNSKDIAKVKKGDIIVSPMTRPNFVPAMEKASAFITDEGGVLCHAAIVAREMDKPCIIGTNTATKVLKDGDIVEIDGSGVKVVKKLRS